ncbi:putative AMP-dependent synthetase and ligase [Carnobacterium maltaromaticum]|uniref:phenylacetate--CoA ligase family protein n=1 Tax=Carnobacterium maltaromaticum TaxID=2751 RepID=UPI00191BA324|nr:phenylacetate--CoA ligase family protein [Carnobacterium maltaromaticum]CAD5897341.1 putative AMP-dependent synthetase and ligase [Carnobacterium maltaromaticum]
MKKFDELINYSVEAVPYYRSNKNLYCNKKYEAIPYLEKSEVKNNSELFVSDQYNKENMLVNYTSGSTGIPLKIYKSQGDEIRAGKILWDWRRKFAQITPKDKQVNFFIRRYTKENEIEKSIVIKKKNLLELSLLNLNEKNIEIFIEAINEFRPKWIFGPPSVLFILAKHIQSKDINYSFDYLSLIEVSGEFCTKEQRETISQVFQTPVANMYGSMETLMIAYQCPEGHMHIIDDNVLTETNELDEVIVTALNNFGMPLIKYKLGDKGCLKEITCPHGNKVIELYGGRVGKYIEYNRQRYSSAVLFDCIAKYNEKHPKSIGQFKFIRQGQTNFLLEIIIDCDHNSIDIDYLKVLFYEYFPGSELKVQEVKIINLKNNKISYYVEENFNE